jgi:hypothetical protein
MDKDADPDRLSDAGETAPEGVPSHAEAREHGAEYAPDDTAPDIVVRGAKKDHADAEKRRRRET